MQIADLEGNTLIDIAIGTGPIKLSVSDRRNAMALVRELQTLGFVDSITPFKGVNHGLKNDGARAPVAA